MPKAFAVTDVSLIQAEIECFSFGTLVSLTSEGLVATHVPILLDRTAGELGTLLGHISRANLQWKQTVPDLDALMIFLGPDGYVSPGWYPSKRETGRVVPTWNYAAVHASGPLSFFEDAERLRDVVTRLTEKHESRFPAPWSPTDAPPSFIDSQLKAITGFEMPIRKLEGKHKFNQNRSLEDRRGVIEGLKNTGEEQDVRVAEFMQSLGSKT